MLLLYIYSALLIFYTIRSSVLLCEVIKKYQKKNFISKIKDKIINMTTIVSKKDPLDFYKTPHVIVFDNNEVNNIAMLFV